jgi:hypothetical protein
MIEYDIRINGILINSNIILYQINTTSTKFNYNYAQYQQSYRHCDLNHKVN